MARQANFWFISVKLGIRDICGVFVGDMGHSGASELRGKLCVML